MGKTFTSNTLCDADRSVQFLQQAYAAQKYTWCHLTLALLWKLSYNYIEQIVPPFNDWIKKVSFIVNSALSPLPANKTLPLFGLLPLLSHRSPCGCFLNCLTWSLGCMVETSLPLQAPPSSRSHLMVSAASCPELESLELGAGRE